MSEQEIPSDLEGDFEEAMGIGFFGGSSNVKICQALSLGSRSPGAYPALRMDFKMLQASFLWHNVAYSTYQQE